jgi:hypothetical protein
VEKIFKGEVIWLLPKEKEKKVQSKSEVKSCCEVQSAKTISR